MSQRSRQGGEGGREGVGGWEKEISKKDGSCPHQHAHTSQSRLSKDNQLRCKCSPEWRGGGWGEGGEIERSPVSLACEHKVCLW